ncbi:hypothetical protein TeGR_g4195 [Tetraparma gracilis]|uniref:Uncharacterized protein n=1 Tax=Tetraparma gracilis TaxID=2962635 RepID=A0ABQ6MDE9_9STRA|nr:hypothetical protein TeGR_g4195 [Tetraparma gracilis]
MLWLFSPSTSTPAPPAAVSFAASPDNTGMLRLGSEAFAKDTSGKPSTTTKKKSKKPEATPPMVTCAPLEAMFGCDDAEKDKKQKKQKQKKKKRSSAPPPVITLAATSTWSEGSPPISEDDASNSHDASNSRDGLSVGSCSSASSSEMTLAQSMKKEIMYNGSSPVDMERRGKDATCAVM